MAHYRPAGELSAYWNTRYTRQQQKNYKAGDQRLPYDPSKKAELITAFLDSDLHRSRQLDPPISFRYSSLRRFLLTGDMGVFNPASSVGTVGAETILLDERRDPTGDATSTRVWDSDGKPGYLRWPPKGDVIFQAQ